MYIYQRQTKLLNMLLDTFSTNIYCMIVFSRINILSSFQFSSIYKWSKSFHFFVVFFFNSDRQRMHGRLKFNGVVWSCGFVLLSSCFSGPMLFRIKLTFSSNLLFKLFRVWKLINSDRSRERKRDSSTCFVWGAPNEIS